MKTIIYIILLCLSTSAFAQTKPSDYFKNPKTKVLVVGSFHLITLIWMPIKPIKKTRWMY